MMMVSKNLKNYGSIAKKVYEFKEKAGSLIESSGYAPSSSESKKLWKCWKENKALDEEVIDFYIKTPDHYIPLISILENIIEDLRGKLEGKLNSQPVVT